MLRQDASSTPDLRLFERGDTATELELHLALHTVVVALRVTHQQELHEAPEAVPRCQYQREGKFTTVVYWFITLQNLKFKTCHSPEKYCK